jgi:hypothetical protein
VKKYDGKIVELTGVVYDVGMEGSEFPIISFEGEDERLFSHG